MLRYAQVYCSEDSCLRATDGVLTGLEKTAFAYLTYSRATCVTRFFTPGLRKDETTLVFDQHSSANVLENCNKEFRNAFKKFLYNHGSRGPNEWDIGAHTYETKPELALSMLNSMRKQDDAADPILAFERNVKTEWDKGWHLLEQNEVIFRLDQCD